MVFEQFDRKYWDIKTYGESNYSFLDRSAWPLASFARDFINDWALNMGGDKDLVSKLKSKHDKKHDAAVLELLYFAICKSKGLNISKNAVMAGTKMPDFAIDFPDGQKVFVECSLSENAMETHDERRKKESVLQYVEEMKDFPFFINVHFVTTSFQSLLKRPLGNFLRELAGRYNHTQPGQIIPAVHQYHAQGWELNFTLIKKNGNISRSRGMETASAKIVDNFKPLYKALTDKRPAKYDIAGNPYLICIGVDDLTANDFEFYQSLFGPFNPGVVNPLLKGKGFFLYEGKPLNTNVSGVLFCKYMKVFGLNLTKIKLWHNPFARYPALVNWPFDEIFFEPKDEVFIRREKQAEINILQVLGIEENAYAEMFDWKKRGMHRTS